ncbi:hypothetical protein [Actinosynnema sp. NPDC020468]|uniref:hypothetical protein n=1 Tax=Actinosynnema sp. NPDC020468 TaxID=3154488 RepID=UPI0033FCC45A
MKFARLAAGVCLVSALAGCAAPSGLSAPAVPRESTSAVAHAAPAAPDSAYTPFGVQRVWANGLSITVSAPKSLKPSGTSFPKSPRTAVFVVTIANGTGMAYRTNQLAVKALLGGTPVPEVLDSVQGLNGIGTAVNEVPAGGETTLTLAYAVPENTVRLQLLVEPNGADQVPGATFEGQA